MGRDDHTNYIDGILEQARLRPDAVAVDGPAGHLTFAELAAAMGGVAAGLRARGIVPGDAVAVVCRDSRDYLVAAFGTVLGGFVLLALHPNWTAAAAARLVAAVGPAGVIGAGGAIAGRPAIALADLPPADPRPVRDPGGDRVCQVAVSSGTTGPAKIAPVGHRRLLMRTRAMTGPLGIDASSRYMPLVSPALAIGRGPALRTLDVGGTVVLRPAAPSPAAQLAEMARLGITYLSVTPDHVYDFLRHVPAGAGPAMPGMRTMMVNSAALPPGQCAAARARLTPNVHITYGSNEMGYVAHAGPRELDAHPGTVGRVLPGIAVEAIDDAGRPLPPGETGELRIRAPHLAEAYLHDPAAAGRAFRDGWFHPGDVGRLTADGHLFLAGRVDDRINRAGVKIFPAEIVDVLTAHPAVADAAAIAMPSARDGEVPAAAVVLRGRTTERALQQFVEARLGWLKTPVCIARVDVLPRSPAGKIEREALRERIRAWIAAAEARRRAESVPGTPAPRR